MELKPAVVTMHVSFKLGLCVILLLPKRHHRDLMFLSSLTIQQCLTTHFHMFRRIVIITLFFLNDIFCGEYIAFDPYFLSFLDCACAISPSALPFLLLYNHWLWLSMFILLVS